MILDFLRFSHVGADLGPYVDGTLESPRRERLDRHVAHCSACSREVTDLRRQRALTASLGTPEVPASLQERLLQFSTAQAPQAAPWVDSRRRSRGIRRAVTVGVASVTGVAVVGVGTLYLVGGRPLTATPVGLTAAVAATSNDTGGDVTASGPGSGGAGESGDAEAAGDLLALLGVSASAVQAPVLEPSEAGAQSVAASWPEDWVAPARCRRARRSCPRR